MIELKEMRIIARKVQKWLENSKFEKQAIVKINQNLLIIENLKYIHAKYIIKEAVNIDTEYITDSIARFN